MKKVRVIIACIMVFGLLLTFQNVGAAPPETKDKAADVKKAATDAKKPAEVKDKKADPAKTDPAAKLVYHGNKNSKVYHAPGCKDYDCKNCTEKFASKEDAVKAGYKAHNCVK